MVFHSYTHVLGCSWVSIRVTKRVLSVLVLLFIPIVFARLMSRRLCVLLSCVFLRQKEPGSGGWGGGGWLEYFFNPAFLLFITTFSICNCKATSFRIKH